MSSYTLTVNDQEFEVQVGPSTGGTVQVTVNGIPYNVGIRSRQPSGGRLESPPGANARQSMGHPAGLTDVRAGEAAFQVRSRSITAPIPGKIIRISVHAGEPVKAGQVLAVMESMKMENNIVSPAAGTIAEIRVTENADVSTGDVIIVIAETGP